MNTTITYLPVKALGLGQYLLVLVEPVVLLQDRKKALAVELATRLQEEVVLVVREGRFWKFYGRTPLIRHAEKLLQRGTPHWQKRLIQSES